MPNVTIYSTAVCPYCVRAKSLLQRKGVSFKEIKIEGDRDAMREMLSRSKRKTVPQIFIDDLHVGGYEELAELDSTGQLNDLLQISDSEAN